jgi:copper(I)-binding protein
MRIMNVSLMHGSAIAALFLIIFLSVVNAAELTVTDGWIRALPASVPSGGYFTLHNGSSSAVTLTGASSPACGMLMLHQTENMGGMSNMQDVSSVNVPAGGTVKFAPGGYHLMCMDATKAIQPGKTVPVTLNFANGTKIVSTFAVRAATGK